MPTLHRIFGCLRLLMIALLFIAYTKKSGTALLLFRYMRLSHCLLFRTSNTEAHADMYAHAHLFYKVYGYGYTYPEDIKMLQCVGIILEFARFHVAKHKARWKPHKTSFIGDPF